jgi:hypothetical protein
LDHFHEQADSVLDRLSRSAVPAAQQATAQSRAIRAALDCFSITLVSENVYEWGGSRYGNAPDAIAAAKRGSKPTGRTKHR